MDNFQGDLTDIIRSSNSTTTAAATTPPDHGRRRQSRGSHQGNTAAADDLHHVERLLSLGSLNVEDDDPACSSIDPYHAMRFSDFIDPFLVIGGTSCDDSRFRFSATKMVDAAATRGGEEDPGDIIPNSYNYCNHNCYSYNDDDPSSVGRDSPLTAAVVEASSSPPRRQPPPAGGGGGENEDDSTNIIVCGDLKVSATGGCGSSSSNYDAAAGIQIPSPRNPALKRSLRTDPSP